MNDANAHLMKGTGVILDMELEDAKLVYIYVNTEL